MAEDAAPEVCRWLEEHNIRVLNVTGPRASNDQTIYQDVRSILLMVLKHSFKKNTQK